MFRNGVFRTFLIGSVVAGLFRMVMRRNRRIQPNRMMRMMGRRGNMMNGMNINALMRAGRRLVRNFGR